MEWKGAARAMSAGEFARAAEAIGCDVATIKAVFEVESAEVETLSDLHYRWEFRTA